MDRGERGREGDKKIERVTRRKQRIWENQARAGAAGKTLHCLSSVKRKKKIVIITATVTSSLDS